MSDTCWLTIRFSRKDLDKFNEVLKEEIWNGRFWDEDHSEEGDDEVNAVIYEANYGWSDQLQNLAEAGLTFSGEHSAGGEYGPMAFACFEGEFLDVNTDHDGSPTVTAYKRGAINEAEMERVNKYYDILDKIEAKKR
jgi:hypothetical protein